MAFFAPKARRIHQRGHLDKKEGGRNILPPFGVLKSLAELAARRRQSRQFGASRDMRVEKKYLSVCQCTICARSRLQRFLSGNRKRFPDK